ncbi:MAG: YitT family protein [Bacteroidaceae bacterium]|nr:YitT family protein [Bacteroidaceae bacterium]
MIAAPYHKLFLHELQDYLLIAVGLACYAFSWTTFMLPYEITTGGVTGIAAIIFYATGIEIQVTYLIINAILLTFALKILGWKFCAKTIYAVVLLTVLLKLGQLFTTDGNGGFVQVLGEGENFMACVIGSILCGIGIGICFAANGSTGGTDIIAAIINKYYTISLGRVIMLSDIIIIGSSYFVFHDITKMMFGYVALVIISVSLDYFVNSARQSIQFIIISYKYNEIADYINNVIGRGVTVLNGMGWYSKSDSHVLVVLVRRNDANILLRSIKQIDPNAFVSMSRVAGVYGQGFDKIKDK